MLRRHEEDTVRVLALALAFFGGLALLAFAGGVFERLGRETTLLLAGFGLAYAVLTYHLDPGVRNVLKRVVRPRARVGLKGKTA